MATTKKDPVLVILQLTGANDYLNTIVPYTNGLYWDNRPKVNIPEHLVVPIDDELAFRSDMDSFKDLYDQGKLAIINGIGFEDSPRSHFRAMDIWHTCEPDKIGIDGWVAKIIRDLDPAGENVLKGVNFGQGLPRAMTMRGVSVTSVNHLATYGVFSSVRSSEQERAQLLDSFARMYAPAIGAGPTMEYLGQTGLDALKGADMIKVAPELYSSTIEYGNTAISTALKDVAQVHLAGLGTQVFYTSYGPFDTHFNQSGSHAKLWIDVSEAVDSFFADLREHDAAENVVMMVFSEFGRRVRDNGTGTDHGAAGVAFAIGDRVNGGMYGTYPSLKPEDLTQGDLAPSYDFRGFYATLVDKWLGLDPVPIVGGQFEQMAFV
ncbi:MAG: hypothetical protein COA56_09975 [Dehalococcoidia bacterium]|jgi:uncharacterized protein (DUF1501 family)|nr:DUF1501 domain-containing protein [Dehalococcoidia bacterium]PCJ76049.1 MAG: hypothetical protein COA56_09975 [Dehalococcoidia bacterium]PKB85207.1 MAG: hypothetical protein BZY86_03740 [SAR202 cluster bacterium MP-NPac-SRR3961935-G1]RUA29884.1 MAG: hypothetical protein DSY78_11170 [Chloroflexota bacterium]HIM63232.1 DUF1501 domain-containing protein [Dehalococcoidia bacterium]|tara:strand:- start:2533 stop:3663 length:1131 start_codon:yes stop_codon:yes gene_type:complete